MYTSMGEITQPNVGGLVDTPEALDKLMELATIAQESFATFSQEAVDRIFQRCALAANQQRVTLAEITVNEAGMGNVEDKTLKNHFASEVVYSAYKGMQTCGVVEHDEAAGFSIYAEPVGVLAGIVPCTNPTSTTIFKALIALKTRNCIVFSPHPRTVRCTIAAAKIIRDAAIAAGAPENCIGWIDKGSIDLCNRLMRHDKVAMIVATGAGGLVKAAYSSGKPCMGGGAGNTPVIIDETADIPMAVNSVLLSKTFDNGMICASEQAIVAVKQVADRVKQEFVKRGAYILESEEDKAKLARFIFNENGGLNPAAVGQAAHKLAEGAGLQNYLPGCRVLIAELKHVGSEETLSREKLCPCLGFYVVDDFDEALNVALRLVKFGGLGHTSVLYTDLHGEQKRSRVEKFETMMPTGRTLVCMPTSHGGIGRLYNPCQFPSLSLGCGSWGGNASAEGLQPKHLINYKQVAERRGQPQTFKVPESICFGTNILKESLKQLEKTSGFRCATIVTETTLENTDVLREAKEALRSLGLSVNVFSSLSYPLSTSSVVQAAKDIANKQHPDVLVAVGSGHILDAAKLIRLFVEDPHQDWETLSARFMSISQRIVKFPQITNKIKKLVCIPTTSGSGSEMSPFAFAVGTKDKSYLLMDYSLTPDIAVVDYSVTQALSKEAAAESGFCALSDALESLVSLMASNYTRNLSLEASELLLKHLLLSVTTSDPDARAECHRAASIAGMAGANAFLGISSALAHQLTLHFQLPCGIAKAMVMCQVIRFNAEDAPSKLGTFPEYEKPKAKSQYAQALVAAGLGAKEDSADASLDTLVAQLVKLKEAVGIPKSLQQMGIDEKTFLEKLNCMAIRAFDHQFTTTNPRYPLVAELRAILMDAYYGRIRTFRFNEAFLATADSQAGPNA